MGAKTGIVYNHKAMKRYARLAIAVALLAMSTVFVEIVSASAVEESDGLTRRRVATMTERVQSSSGIIESTLGYFEQHRDAFAVAWQIAAILGLLIGGGWTLRRAIKTRQHYPSANVDLEVQREVRTPHGAFLRVVLKISNVGKVILRVGAIEVWIQQVTPSDPARLIELKKMPVLLKSKEYTPTAEGPWRVINEHRIEYRRSQLMIEPKETDEIVVEMFCGEYSELLLVYAHIERYPRWFERRLRIDDRRIKLSSDSQFGWGRSVYYVVGEGSDANDEDNVKIDDEEGKTSDETGNHKA